MTPTFVLYVFFDLFQQFTVVGISSVAREGAGGLETPIGLKSMQNNKFLVLLRLIFAPKMKTAHPTGFGSRRCEGVAVIWTRIVEIFCSGTHPKSVKTFFFLEIT